MNFRKSIWISVILFNSLVLSSPRATTQQIQQVSEGQVIEMYGYSVEVPPGKDWEIKTDKVKGSIEFQKFEKNPLGQVTGVIIINVFQDMLGPEAWQQSEEEIANNIRNFEEKDMIERGVKTEQFILEDMTKDITTIDGKKLYTLSYTIKERKEPVYAKAVLYLYFPRDFKQRHIIYRFLIHASYEKLSKTKPELTIIHPVINSLQITNPALAYQVSINALMIRAAATGNTHTVKDLINKGADVNAKEENGFTPLMLSSWHGHIDIVQHLIAKGAHVNAKTNEGLTALLSALEQGHYDIAKILIASGADVNVKGMDDRTPLMGESYRGNYDIVKLLLDSGADVNAKDKDGLTALMWAVSSGHTEVVSLLIEKGADVNLKNKKGYSALSIAKKQGNSEIIILLEKAGAKE